MSQTHQPLSVRGWMPPVAVVPDFTGRPLVQRVRLPALPQAGVGAPAGVGAVVHEMRNFLAPMAHAIEVLRRSGGNAANGPVLDLLQRQTAGLQRLVTDLLDVSRASSGKLRLEREACALQDVARHAIDTCAPAASERAQRLLLEAPAAPVMLHADPMRLCQAIANLVFNAIRHSPQGAPIVLEVSTEPGAALVQVRDQGEGLPGGFAEHAFDFGAQARPGEAGGLYLVRCVAQLHGGTVEARSGGPGLGSTFTVRLPIVSCQRA